MNNSKNEFKEKFLKVATGEIKLSAKNKKEIKKEDRDDLLSLSIRVLENKDILYALENPASEEEINDTLEFIKEKHRSKSKSIERKESFIQKLFEFWKERPIQITSGIAVFLFLLIASYHQFFSNKEYTLSQKLWIELKQNKPRGFSQNSISIKKKAFLLGFYTELFRNASNSDYSEKELDEFILPFLPNSELKIRLKKIKGSKDNLKESDFRSELVSILKEAENKYKVDMQGFGDLGKSLFYLYINTFTKEISLENKKQIESSIHFLEKSEDYVEGMISKKNLLELFKNANCERKSNDCEKIRNRVYLIIGI